MGFYDAIRVGASGAADSGYTVNRSLRFDDGSSTDLSRTPSSTGNQKVWTFSAWIKLAHTDAGPNYIYSAHSGGDYFALYFRYNQLYSYFSPGNNYGSISDRKLRDLGAWFHLVHQVDALNTTQKIWINGTELSLNSSRNPGNSNYPINKSGVTMKVGNATWRDDNIDSYMAEIHYSDGNKYTPSDFVETDADTGQLIPKEVAINYGTNGFYLNFSDNSGTTATTLGKDSSGNGNNFTPNNFSVSAGAGNDSLEDTPTNNFCTLNPLSLIGTGGTISNGNLDFTGDSNYSTRAANFSLKTGKWYWEGTPTSVPSASAPQAFGIVRGTNIGSNSYIGYDPNGNVAGFGYFSGGSIKGAAGVGSTSGNNLATGQTTYTQNDVIGLASDIANGTLAFYKNGTLVYTITGISSFDWFPAQTTYSTGGKNSVNFGQRPFAHTPPTGHKALCSANLAAPTILLPNEHFDSKLWTGNSSSGGSGVTQNISGLNFAPDWVWIKNRSHSNVHSLHDTVRGVNKQLYSASTDAETSYPGRLQAFNSNGYQLGADGDVNFNNYTYVGWNWNAGETDGKTYTVKVASPQNYQFDNFATNAVTLDLAEGGTYIFNMDDSSNASHPFSIGTAANGTVYTSGITYFLDGVSKTYSEYTSGFYSATTRRLHFTVPTSAPQLYYWCSVHSGMGGAINTNSTLGSSNFDGSIQSTAKVNATAGFSIVTYTGTSASTATIGHGLGVTPNVIIVRERDNTSQWAYFQTQLGFGSKLNLDLTDAVGGSSLMNQTAPTSTVFTVKNTGSGDVLNNGGLFIAYCFSEVAGYSKFGKYTGNGSSDGPFVFTNFTPRWILMKCTGATGNWVLIDTERPSGGNFVNYNTLSPNLNSAENSSGGVTNDILSNGFKLRGATDRNINGQQHIYLAFAESPFKNARAR